VNSATSTADDLVVSHLPLVGYHVSEVLTRVPASVNRDDLASAGHLALVLASRAYDASTGVPFARYAALRIRGALIDELRAMDWAGRGSRHRAREVVAAGDRLAATLGRTPSRQEVAAELGTDVAAVDRARQDAERRVLSIDSTVHPVEDLVVDDAPGPEDALLAVERLRYLRAGVAALPERLREVVEALYLQDVSVADLADRLGVTQSRISQLRSEGLALLRDGLNSQLDPDLVPAAERPDGVAARRRQAYFAAVAARAAMAATDHGHPLTTSTVPQQRPARSVGSRVGS